MEKIKICIVEDDAEFQEQISEKITKDEDIEILDTFSKGEEAIAKIPDLNPHIVIMDLTLKNSKFNGIETMLQLKLVAPDIKFLVLSSHSDEKMVFESLRVGAGAYLHKEDISRELTNSIKDFYKGGAPMSPGIADLVIKSFHIPTSELQLIQRLTAREKEILDYLSDGFLYKEIADKLGIKEGTVKQHTHKIYLKLQVNNRAEAIKKYLGY